MISIQASKWATCRYEPDLLLSRMNPPEIGSSGSTSSSPVDMIPTFGGGITFACGTPTVARRPICVVRGIEKGVHHVDDHTQRRWGSRASNSSIIVAGNITHGRQHTSEVPARFGCPQYSMEGTRAYRDWSASLFGIVRKHLASMRAVHTASCNIFIQPRTASKRHRLSSLLHS